MLSLPTGMPFLASSISKVVLGDFSVIDQGSHIGLPTLEDSQGNTDSTASSPEKQDLRKCNDDVPCPGDSN